MNNQNLHGRPGGAPYDRDREMDDRHRAIQQHEEMSRRDQERERERERERESADRYQSAHQSSAGSIPIHQPVASRISGAIHSPGGLLANHNGSNSSMPIGGPSGPLPSYGAGQNDHSRQMQHGGQSSGSSQHQAFAAISHSQAPQNPSHTVASGTNAVFGGPLQGQQQDAQRAAQPGPPASNVAQGGHQIPGGITQGQQPILNVSSLLLYNQLSSEPLPR